MCQHLKRSLHQHALIVATNVSHQLTNLAG